MDHPQFLAVFDGVSKSYSGFAALKGISFDIRKGEVLGFIGPNGAGKTTTMKILVGLLSDFSGSLTVSGLRMPENRVALSRLIGYMPQNIAFQEWRTVDQALITFGMLSGVDKASLAERIPRVLEQIGLADARKRKVIHLSGGMAQKLGLAQALLHEPELMVLDEPLSGLDPGSRTQFKAIIKVLREKGVTVFFSSHILSDVQDVADRIVILGGGRILKTGTLEELKSDFSAREDIEIVLSQDAGGGDIEAIPGVAAVERTGPHMILLRLLPQADSDAVSHAVITRLLQGGSRIRSFRPLTPSLDDLYLKYVGEGNAS
jgi:ABC-2 type transport system ATP-binding protein